MKFLLGLCLLFCSSFLIAQSSFPELDKSPLDISYFPVETTFRNFQKGDGRNLSPKARVIYSRPQMKGRDIYGALIPADKFWRLGANESTEITFYQPVMIGKKKVDAGTYNIFAKVQDNNWEFFFSSDLHTWGAYNIDESKFIAQVKGSASINEESIEALTIVFEESDNGTNLVIAWDRTRVNVPITFL